MTVWLVGIIFTGVFFYRSLHLSQVNMLWADEFCSWNLITDPSFTHAYTAWESGADSGGLLFYVIARFLISILGHNPLVIRMYSSFCFWSAGLIWWTVLRRRSSDLVAALCISIIWLGSSLIAYHSEEVRFYGQFFLAFSLLACFLIATQRARVGRAAYFGSVFILSTFLILSHTLGLIYSAVMLLAVLLCRQGFVSRWLITSATVLSWSIFSLLRTTLKNQAGIAWGLKPTLGDLVRYYLKNPFASRSLDVIFYVCILFCILEWTRRGRLAVFEITRSLELVLMVLLFLLPPIFAAAAYVGIPLAADRYLLPYLCGCVIALNYATENLAKWSKKGFHDAAILLVFAIAIVIANWTATNSVWYRPVGDLAKILSLPGRDKIVINDTTLNYQLNYYYPAEASRFIMVFAARDLHPPLLSGGAVLQHFGYLKHVQSLHAVVCQQSLLALDSHDNPQIQRLFEAEAPGVRMTNLGALKVESYEWSLIQLKPGIGSCQLTQSRP